LRDNGRNSGRKRGIFGKLERDVFELIVAQRLAEKLGYVNVIYIHCISVPPHEAATQLYHKIGERTISFAD
jgi:hypothetical protein